MTYHVLEKTGKTVAGRHRGRDATMKSINRNIVIFKPRKPFLDWLAKLPDPDPEITLEYLRTDCIGVLIPECDNENGIFEFIGNHFNKIFETELMSWHTFEVNWPRKRTFAQFKEWFDFEFHSEVIDLVEAPIIKEDFAL